MTISWDFPTRYAALLIIKSITTTSLKEWAIIRSAESKLEVTPKDAKEVKFDYKPEKGVATWGKKEGAKKKDFDLDEQFLKFLREQMKILDDKKVIPMELLPLAAELGMS